MPDDESIDDIQPITGIIYTGGKSYMPESLAIHPNATPEQIQRIKATMYALNSEVTLSPERITRKNADGEILYIPTNTNDGAKTTYYVKRDGEFYDAEGKKSATQKENDFHIATQEVIRFKNLGRDAEELIRALSVAGEHGLIDDSVQPRHEALVAEEEASYRAPFNPFNIFESTFPNWIYKAGRSLLGRGKDAEEKNTTQEEATNTKADDDESTGPQITIPKAFGLQDRAADFARELNQNTISTISIPYLIGDGLDLVKATVNSYNMVRPAGLGDYGFGGLALASTLSMNVFGSYNDGMNATERINAKRRANYSSDDQTKTQATQADRNLSRQEIGEIHKKENYEEIGDSGGMFGNFVSGFSLAFAGMVQLDPFKFTQGCIVATGFGVALAGKYFAKPLDALFSAMPEGIKKRVPNQLQELWARTLDDYHYPIRYVKNHNMMGLLSTAFNLVKNPGRIEEIETTYDPDAHPEYRGVEAEKQPDGSYKIVRAGDWREKNTEQLRNMLNYVRDGWVAVDEEGRMSPINDKFFAETRNKTEPYDVTYEGKKYTLHPVPHAFEWDKDPQTGQVDYSKPPEKFTQFYDSVAKWQMFNRLVPSSIINFFEICTYLIANNLLGSVKDVQPELDLQAYYSQVALDLAKPVPGQTIDEQAEHRESIYNHAVQYIDDYIQEENTKVLNSLNRHFKLAQSKQEINNMDEFLEKVRANPEDYKKPVVGDLGQDDDGNIIITNVPGPKTHYQGISRALNEITQDKNPLRTMVLQEYEQARQSKQTDVEKHLQIMQQEEAVGQVIEEDKIIQMEDIVASVQQMQQAAVERIA